MLCVCVCTRTRVCLRSCPILMQPHLHNCWISCYDHRSIETVRSNQIIWCHHMGWIIFRLMPKMGVLLWPEYHISVTISAIGGTFITEKNLLAGCSTWELSSTAQHMAPIHVGTWQFIHKSQVIQPHSQTSLHVVSHCWPLHTKLWWWLFPLNIVRECWHGNGGRCSV